MSFLQLQRISTMCASKISKLKVVKRYLWDDVYQMILTICFSDDIDNVICQMILTIWFSDDDDNMICQMMLTTWFFRWCWQYDLSNDVDNMICQTMLTIWFVRWCWQYDLSDDIDNMICLMMLTICASLSEMWFQRQMIFLMTSTMTANITSQLCDAYKIMHNAHCTCDHPV